MSDQGAEGLISPYLRKKRFEAAIPHLKGMVLDFGCGSGGLAAVIRAEQYLGVERDHIAREQAKLSFPHHRFVPELPEIFPQFDTIVALAVIEHFKNPAHFLQMLSPHLNNLPESRVVLTTPHPLTALIHKTGATFGLFSKHANEEHEELLDRKKLESAGNQANLQLVSYQRFLFGVNQIAVYAKGPL